MAHFTNFSLNFLCGFYTRCPPPPPPPPTDLYHDAKVKNGQKLKSYRSCLKVAWNKVHCSSIYFSGSGAETSTKNVKCYQEQSFISENGVICEGTEKSAVLTIKGLFTILKSANTDQKLPNEAFFQNWPSQRSFNAKFNAGLMGDILPIIVCGAPWPPERRGNYRRYFLVVRK